MNDLTPGYKWATAPIRDSDEYWDYAAKGWLRADDARGWGKRLAAAQYRRVEAEAKEVRRDGNWTPTETTKHPIR